MSLLKLDRYRLTIKKITPENIEVLARGAKASIGIEDSLTHNIYCSSKKEAEHVRKRILECGDILYKYCRYNGFIDLKILGMIKYDQPNP